jgi:hypothetical protein
MTQTALQRLLKYPHAAVFDVAPAAELAFRLRHPSGASWSIADRVLTATAGALTVTHDLRQHTVGALAAQLVTDGFMVESLSSQFLGLSAVVLVEGSGDQVQSNGDHITGFTSLLWVLLSGYADEVLGAREQVRQALLQMVIGTADGEWLDLWAVLYGVPRLPGETDAALRVRIPREAFRARNNARAIELAIRDATGFDVRIEEPWREIFQLDNSELSGSAKFQDGQRVGHHLIQPVARSTVDWDAVGAVIDRNRAAGVLSLPPLITHTSVVNASTGHVLQFGALRQRFGAAQLDSGNVLDENLVLSDGAGIVLNHPFKYGVREVRRVLAHVVVPSQPWIDEPWGDESWSGLQYLVSDALHVRDYRTHYAQVEYLQSWSRPSSWNTPETWAAVGPAVRSEFTRILMPEEFLLTEDSDYLTDETGDFLQALVSPDTAVVTESELYILSEDGRLIGADGLIVGAEDGAQIATESELLISME